MKNYNEETMTTSHECQSEPKITRYHIEYAEHDTTPSDWCDCLIGKLYIVRWRDWAADEYPYEVDVRECCDPDDFMEALEKELPKGSIIEPVYRYSHGGDTISRTPFSCPWDSRWVGVFVITPEEARSLHGWKKMSKKRWDIAKKDADMTFNMWKAYVEGEVYDVSRVFDHDGEEDWECIYRCYGDEDLETSLREEIEAMFSPNERRKVKVTGDYDFCY